MIATTGADSHCRPQHTPVRIPPEVLAAILDWLQTDRRSLYACALVNRMWTSFARPKLWVAPPRVLHTLSTFLSALENWESTPNLNLPDPATFITKLEFQVTERNLDSFCRVLPRMQPSLKHLTLMVSYSYRPVFERLVDSCPKTVRRLQIKWHIYKRFSPSMGSGEEQERQEADNNNNDQGGTSQFFQTALSRPTLDPIKLQQFFSQFIDISWMGRDSEPYFVLPSAHGRLQSIRLSWGLSERELRQFILSCSSALVVANLVDLAISDENLLLLGRTCPHLQVLFMDLQDDDSDGAFQSLLGMVGGSLEYLDVFIETWRVNAIDVRRCPKLAHLFLHTNGRDLLSRSQNVLNLIRALGPKLKSLILDLDVHNWEWVGRDLVEVIAAHCPNIEVLRISHLRISKACEKTNGNLLFEKCRRLQVFCYVVDEDWSCVWERGRDGQCRVRTNIDCNDFWGPVNQYLDRLFDTFVKV